MTLELSGQGDLVKAEEEHARGGDCTCRGIKVRSSGAGAHSAGRQGPSGRPGTACGECGLYPTGDGGEQGRPHGNLCSRKIRRLVELEFGDHKPRYRETMRKLLQGSGGEGHSCEPGAPRRHLLPICALA